MNLWHRTCDHGRRGLGLRGVLRPNPHPFLGDVPLVWLSDERDAGREDLGLTSSSGLLACDRMQFLYRVVGHSAAVPWLGSTWRASAAADVIEMLEQFSQPARWFVSARPVHVVLAARAK